MIRSKSKTLLLILPVVLGLSSCLQKEERGSEAKQSQEEEPKRPFSSSVKIESHTVGSDRYQTRADLPKIENRKDVQTWRKKLYKIESDRLKRRIRDEVDWMVIQKTMQLKSEEDLLEESRSGALRYQLEPGIDMEVCNQRDNRVTIRIPFRLRDNFLQGMRRFLDRIALITEALADEDFEKAEKVALGFVLNKLRLKRYARSGDPGFAALGVKTEAIDSVHLIKELRTKDMSRSLKALTRLTKSCNQCHRNYRYTEWPSGVNYERLPPKTPITLPEGFDMEFWGNEEE